MNKTKTETTFIENLLKQIKFLKVEIEMM